MIRGGRVRRTPDLILYWVADAVAVTGGSFCTRISCEELSLVLRAAAAAE